MKKLLTYAGCFLLALGMTACTVNLNVTNTDSDSAASGSSTGNAGNNTAESKTGSVDKNIDVLLQKGYDPGAISVSEDDIRVMFDKYDEGDPDDYYDYDYEESVLVICEYSNDAREMYDALDIFSESYDEDTINFVKSLTARMVLDVSAYLPSETEIEKYEGRPIADLVNDGYEETGRWTDEGEFVFIYDNGIAEIEVEPVETITEATIDNYSVNDIEALLIDDIDIRTYSMNFMDTVEP